MPSSFASVSRSRSSKRGSGFTLLEILLAIAIIALLSGALIGGSARLLNQQPATPHEVFWKAVQEARKAALKNEHEIRLKFDADKKQFVLLDGRASPVLAVDGFTREEVPLKTFPVAPAHAADLTIELLGPSAKGANVILVGGVLLESQPIKFATFFPDGTCTAFRAQFMRHGASGPPLAIDPWTCAPILPPADPNAPLP